MKAVVVGGHSRNIGKTSVMVGLLQGRKSLPGTAVKVTQHSRQVSFPEGSPNCPAAERDFILTEEQNPHGRGDTSRFLAAGVRRSLWLRVRRGPLAEAFPALVKALGTDEFVMIESNCVLTNLRPIVYVEALDRRKRDFKSSARQFLARADALVSVESRFGNRRWPGLNLRGLQEKPAFPVSRRDYFNPGLCRFVRQKLNLSDADCRLGGASRPKQRREQPWLH